MGKRTCSLQLQNDTQCSVTYTHIKPRKAFKKRAFRPIKNGSQVQLLGSRIFFPRWALFAGGEKGLCGSFKSRLPDSTSIGSKGCVAFLGEDFLVCASCMNSSGSFRRPSPWMGFVGSVLQVTWWQHGPTGYQSWGGERGSHQAVSEAVKTSTMLDWVEPKGKASLVLAMPLSILRSGPGQNIITEMHGINTNPDGKDL